MNADSVALMAVVTLARPAAVVDLMLGALLPRRGSGGDHPRAAALVTTTGMVIEALREERHLHHTFGERYARYVAGTGRFVPRLRRAR